jgi:hypothetical protein
MHARSWWLLGGSGEQGTGRPSVDLVAEQVVYEAPQHRERVRGRIAYVRFNVEGFPRDWHITIQRIIGEGRHAASWLDFSDGGDQYPDFALSTSMKTDGSPG